MVTTKMDKLGTKLLTKVLFNVKTATGSTDDKGDKVMGLQTIDGKLYYFIEGRTKYIHMENKLKGTLFLC